MDITTNKKIESKKDMLAFLMPQKTLSVNLLSRYYALTEVQIQRYKKILNWNCISLNPNVNWKEIHWQSYLTFFITCPPDLQEAVEDNCIECNTNQTFPWCGELIEYYNRNLNWCFLAQNEHFLSNRQLVNTYQSYLVEYEQLMHETLTADKKPAGHYLDILFETKVREVFMGEGNFPKFYGTVLDYDFIQRFENNINWHNLSNYRFVDWTEELVVAYCHKLNKEAVLRNKNFPYTIPMLSALQPTEGHLIAAQDRLWSDLFKGVIEDEIVDTIMGERWV